ncbi:protein AKNAD1 isoform X2 [Colius striatus]|uniref:protein AKNAD1 isoform X2 n=1 Tax=Colius striatus TaxID=57412 RepID=UPI002B1D7707|nr:protein AKNAD1 isoform X2 [Colius striatus]
MAFILHVKLDMEIINKCKPSEWMKTPINSSFSDELGSIIDVTDEEQDLPYDGDVETTCKYSNSLDNWKDRTCTKDTSGILNLACSDDNKNIKATANDETFPQPEESSSHHRGAIGTTGILVEVPRSEASFKKELPVGNCSKPDSKQHLTNSKVSNVLLCHFPQGKLINTCQLIECETIPETSFSESISDTASKPEPSECVKGRSVHERWAASLEEYYLEKHEKVNTGGKNHLLNANGSVSTKPTTGKCECNEENAQLINENRSTRIFPNRKGERDLFKNTVFPWELESCQDLAHYCLPDCSEVASEIKVPKPSDNINSTPAIKRSKSFPVLLRKSLTVNNILETKKHFNSAEAENQGVSIPELLQQQEIFPQSDFPNASTAISSGAPGTSSEAFTFPPIPVQSTHDLSQAKLQHGTTASALPAAGTVEAHCVTPNSLPELTLGEMMSEILKDQTDRLIKKVEDFYKHMTHETVLLQDNYLALNELKRYLGALERNYLTAREEHHNLQMQNFKDKSISIGEFDPERKVEGEIFRLHMLLEDIQEQTDDGKHNASSFLISYQSAQSSYSPCERSVLPTIPDPPKRRDIEAVFVHKNKERETRENTHVMPQTNPFFSEGNNCNLHHINEMELLGRRDLLATKHSSSIMRFLSPEEKCTAEGLTSPSQGTLSQKFNTDEGKIRNTNMQERKAGMRSLFIQRKLTDISDTSLSSNSEDISACECDHDLQSKELRNCKTESYRALNTRLCGERKGLGGRCPRGSRDQFQLRNYKESVQSCDICRNKSSSSSSYSQKRIYTEKAQKNQQPHEFGNRQSERQNLETAKTCCSSTYNKIILSHQYLPIKKSARSKSAVNIRNRNANDSNANILSSALDHAIQTANSLKEATERIVQAVSEDLAEVKRYQL